MSCHSELKKKENLNVESSSVKMIESFHFMEGGNAFINATFSNEALVNLWFCRDKADWDKAYQKKALCKASYEDCASVMMNGSLSTFKTFKGVYSLVAANCDLIKDTVVSFNYTFLNGNSELPVGDEVKPWAYFILGCIWVFIILYSIILDIIGRRYLTPIHFLLFIVSCVRLGFVSSTVYYWFTFRNTGYRVESWNLFAKVFYIFSEGAYLFTIFVISNGWRITTSGVQRSIIRKALGSLIIFLSVLSFFCFTSQYYYLLSLLVVYIIIIPRIFTNMTLM